MRSKYRQDFKERIKVDPIDGICCLDGVFFVDCYGFFGLASPQRAILKSHPKTGYVEKKQATQSRSSVG